MKRKIDIVLYSVCAVVLTLLMAVGIAGHCREYRNTKCCGIKIELQDSSIRQFISAKRIQSIIDNEYGGYINVPISGIKLGRIEDVLAKEGFLEEHEAYFTADGILHIRAKQCVPVVRVSGEKGEWYLCRGGRFFKVDKDWCKGIPLMKGNMRENDQQWVRRTCALGELIADGKIRHNITSLRCDAKGEISMMLEGMEESFVIGQATDLNSKIKRIDRYIGAIAPEKDKAYRVVNVKYDGQIICK